MSRSNSQLALRRRHRPRLGRGRRPVRRARHRGQRRRLRQRQCPGLRRAWLFDGAARASCRRSSPGPSARTRRSTPNCSAPALSSALILANMSQGHRGPVHLHGAAHRLRDLVALPRRRARRVEAAAARPRRWSRCLAGLAFTLFAFYGSGWKPICGAWRCSAPGALVYALMRCARAAPARRRRRGPAAPRGSSRAELGREAAQAHFARPQRPGFVGRAFHAALDPA